MFDMLAGRLELFATAHPLPSVNLEGIIYSSR